MKKNKLTHLSYIYGIIPTILFSFGALSYNIFNYKNSSHIYLINTTNRPSIYTEHNLNFNLIESHKIELKNQNFLTSILLPDDNHTYLDNCYLFFILFLAIAFILILYKDKNTGIFKSQLSTFIQIISNFAMIFWILNTFRYIYLDHLISQTTNDAYSLDSNHGTNGYNRIEFWVFIITAPISYILKKGERMQKEQDLTI